MLRCTKTFPVACLSDYGRLCECLVGLLWCFHSTFNVFLRSMCAMTGLHIVWRSLSVMLCGSVGRLLFRMDGGRWKWMLWWFRNYNISARYCECTASPSSTSRAATAMTAATAAVDAVKESVALYYYARRRRAHQLAPNATSVGDDDGIFTIQWCHLIWRLTHFNIAAVLLPARTSFFCWCFDVSLPPRSIMLFSFRSGFTSSSSSTSSTPLSSDVVAHQDGRTDGPVGRQTAAA